MFNEFPLPGRCGERKAGENCLWLEHRGWQVLGVVENLGDLFDSRNTSTAVHRVAKSSVGEPGVRGQSGYDQSTCGHKPPPKHAKHVSETIRVLAFWLACCYPFTGGFLGLRKVAISMAHDVLGPCDHHSVHVSASLLTGIDWIWRLS